VDAGAVQTNYSLTFGTQPSNIAANEAMTPAPTVTLSESGTAFADGNDAISIPLTLTGNGALSGGTPTAISSATTYTVTVTGQSSATAMASFALTVNGAVTAAQATPTKFLTYGAASSASSTLRERRRFSHIRSTYEIFL
jgi:hypothetical protein